MCFIFAKMMMTSTFAAVLKAIGGGNFGSGSPGRQEFR